MAPLSDIRSTLVEGGEPKRKVARLFKVSAATLYRALAV